MLQYVITSCFISVITVTILDDTIPEDEKTVVVQLTNAVGGANIVNGTATIIILPNDNVAGVLALDKTSVLANEGRILSAKLFSFLNICDIILTLDFFI